MTSSARRLLLICAVLTAGTTTFGCSSTRSAPTGTSTSAQSIVNAPDRSDADRALDAGRHPVDLLTFFDIKPGMRVAELGAGGGYTTELLARAVGPSGVVYGQNSPTILERFAQLPWTARLGTPPMAKVVRLDRDFDDPFPADVHDLDAVLIILVYHDTVWLKVDREKMNQAVYRVLRPGGIYGIIDHSATPGSGTNDVQTLHRIDEKVVRHEVSSAGFDLIAEADFLRNPSDTRDWNDSPSAAATRRGTSDRFVLKFVKPIVLAAND